MSRSLRAVPAELDPAVVAAIDRRLDEVEEQLSVEILLAVESGSRAWGFPSPDSDYDCRFIFVRSRDAYLSPWVKRDVIETPLDAVLDVNGWDLGKALKLALKGNAVVVEWLQSPIVYRGDEAFRHAMHGLVRDFTDRAAIARHYLHLGERQYRTYFNDTKQVALKKIFYALRPAMALRWLRLHPAEAVAPMHFPTLVRESELPDPLTAIVADLLERKAQTRELGTGLLPPEVRAFIEQEFADAALTVASERIHPLPDRFEAAEALFRRFIA